MQAEIRDVFDGKGISCKLPLACLGFLAAVMFALPVTANPLPNHAQQSPKNILVLYSFSERGFFDAVDALKSAVRARLHAPLNFYVEYLESPRFEDPAYEKARAESLQRALAGVKLDLIITAAYPALNFALGHRDQTLKGIPIVYSYIYPGRIIGEHLYPGGHKLGPNVTGVTLTMGLASTVALALRLHPDTTTIAVITNGTDWERYWLNNVQAELRQYRDRIKEVDLVGLPSDVVVQRVSALPARTVILYLIVPQDSFQPVMGPYDLVANIGDRLPTYSIFPKFCLGHGCIGGADYDEKEQTEMTAELASRVLSGEQPDEIPSLHGPGSTLRVDWRQLRRWNISESMLPPGTVVLYRELTVWERDRNYVVAGVVLILAQSLLIAALLWQRARKRKAEAVLGESEKRFRVLADTAPALIWMSEVDKLCTYFNRPWLEFTGRSFEAEFGNGWAEGVHTDDLQKCLETYNQCFDQRQPFRMEYRLRRHDGVYRQIMDLGVPRFNGDGSFAGYIGSAIDITDQKLAQEALETVGGRLIEAQEEERRRIARELHDDISQKLALLSMEIAQVNGNGNGSHEHTKDRLEEIRQHCSDVADDVQSLSHQLHYSKLDYLGVVASIRGFCKEFAQKYELQVQFKNENVPAYLPRNVSLCLFRVAQEALHNAVKYSGVREVFVKLGTDENRVELIVEDAGNGFDVEEAKRNRGLGLISMQERVHLVGGQIYIHSGVGEGTQVMVSVPLIAEEKATESHGHPTKSMAGAAYLPHESAAFSDRNSAPNKDS